jgi:hypothetical protein
MALVPADAPTHERRILSVVYNVGDTVTDEGCPGTVFFLTVVVSFHGLY